MQVTSCESASDCNDTGQPVCTLGVCSTCIAASDCSVLEDRPHCRADGACVQCTQDTDCGGPTPYCSDDARCVSCEDDSQCSFDAPACVAGTCSSCDDDGVTCSGPQNADFIARALCEYSNIFEDEDSNRSGLAAFCAGRLKYLGDYGVVLEGIASGRIVATPLQLREFVAASRDSTTFSLLAIGRFTGQVALGSLCRSSVDCAAGFCDTSSTCASTCSDQPPTTCTTLNDCPTRPNALCVAGTCLTLPALGEPCVTFCAPGLTCNQTTDECEPAHGVGGTCFLGIDCELGLTCSDGTCVTAVEPGDPCWSSSSCANRGRCTENVCVIGVADHVPFSCSVSSECLAGARCVGNMCRRISPPGGPCSSEAEACAVGSACRAGRCVVMADIGESCGGPLPSQQCLRGRCSATAPDFGTCTSAAVGDLCIYVEPTFNDLLDTCGDGVACVASTTGDTCVPDGTVGSECTGTLAAPCTHTGAYCDDNDVCQERCHAD